MNLARIRIWIYSSMPNIRIFEYFGTNICLTPKNLDKYSLKEWKISSVATKTTHDSIPITKFYEKWPHLIKIWMIQGIYPKSRQQNSVQIFEYIHEIFTNIRIYSWYKNSIFVFEYQIFGRKYSNIRIYSNIRHALIWDINISTCCFYLCCLICLYLAWSCFGNSVNWRLFNHNGTDSLLLLMFGVSGDLTAKGATGTWLDGPKKLD